MIRIGILGDIGSGKTFIAKSFGYPVFNADAEVARLYKKNLNVFRKLKKVLPKYINKFPIDKALISKAILANNQNLNKIIKIVHNEIRKKLRIFIKKNKKRKIIILDIPLLLENKINKKNDILIFIQSNKSRINKELKKRPNFSKELLRKFKKIQLPLDYKKKKSDFIIKNNFTKNSVKVGIEKVLKNLK